VSKKNKKKLKKNKKPIQSKLKNIINETIKWATITSLLTIVGGPASCYYDTKISYQKTEKQKKECGFDNFVQSEFDKVCEWYKNNNNPLPKPILITDYLEAVKIFKGEDLDFLDLYFERDKYVQGNLGIHGEYLDNKVFIYYLSSFDKTEIIDTIHHETAHHYVEKYISQEILKNIHDKNIPKKYHRFYKKLIQEGLAEIYTYFTLSQIGYEYIAENHAQKHYFEIKSENDSIEDIQWEIDYFTKEGEGYIIYPLGFMIFYNNVGLLDSGPTWEEIMDTSKRIIKSKSLLDLDSQKN
jgi:hypothetical protein